MHPELMKLLKVLSCSLQLELDGSFLSVSLLFVSLSSLSFHLAISKAYNILSDTEKRERYDRFGEEGLNPQNLNHGHFYRTNFEFDLFRQMFGDNPFDDEGSKL